MFILSLPALSGIAVMDVEQCLHNPEKGTSDGISPSMAIPSWNHGYDAESVFSPFVGARLTVHNSCYPFDHMRETLQNQKGNLNFF